MGDDFSIVLIFERPRTLEVLDHIGKFTSIDHDGSLKLPSNIPDEVITPYESASDDRSVQFDGMQNVRFGTCLYFEMDERLWQYCEQYYRDSDEIKQQIDKYHRFGVGSIDLVLRFGPRHVMLDLRACCNSMSYLFEECKSIRKWAVDVLNKFNGVLGTIDREDRPGILFYRNGTEVDEQAWPYSSLGDPDSIVEHNHLDPYTPERAQRWEAEMNARPQQRFDWLGYYWDRLFPSKPKKDYSFALIFDKGRTWDVLNALKDITDGRGAEDINIRIADRQDLELKDMRFDLTILFEVDEPIRKWWQLKKEEPMTDKASGDLQKTVETIDAMMLTKHQCPVGIIKLEVRFGRQNVLFHFRAPDHAMSMLFVKSLSVRMRFLDMLKRFGGIAGAIDRRLVKGLLFYLDGSEFNRKTKTVTLMCDPDEFPESERKKGYRPRGYR